MIDHKKLDYIHQKVGPKDLKKHGFCPFTNIPINAIFLSAKGDRFIKEDRKFGRLVGKDRLTFAYKDQKKINCSRYLNCRIVGYMQR